MKPSTLPPGGKRRSYHSCLENGKRKGKKSGLNYEVEHYLFSMKKHLVYIHTKNGMVKTRIAFSSLATLSLCET